MAHLAVVCPEDAGHLLPLGALGAALVRRGHRVTLVARPEAAPLATQLGLELCRLETGDFRLPFPHLQWAAFSLAGAGWIANLRQWLLWRSELALRFLPAALGRLGIDGVVTDQPVATGGTVAEHLGLPFVTVCSGVPWHEEPTVPPLFTSWPYREGARARLRNGAGYAAWHWYMGPTLRCINRYRRRWNLKPLRRIGDADSPLAHVSQLCAELDFPRHALPPHFHYVGSLATDRQVRSDDQFPWERLDGRPLIFASMGTVQDRGNTPVLRRIAAACAGLNAQLVLALGRWREKGKGAEPEAIGTLPGDPVVVDFAPQLALLDRAALLITHAGMNTVVEALGRGVPMVALPREGDQPGMAARIERAGIGLLASFRHGTAGDLRSMVERVLADASFRQRAGAVGRALTAAGGAQRAAEIAEQALLTRSPVARAVPLSS
ncbi:MAG: nucleotide disphospho-sugar-binding domain-containing protein [Planctomycetota bacterium]